MTETAPEGSERSLSVFEVMETIHDQIFNTFQENGIELPARQFFDIGGRGEVPHDCDQLSISFEQGYNGTPGVPDPTTICDGPRTGVFVIELVRCMPQPKTTGRGSAPTWPSVEELNAAARRQTQDAYTLMDSAGKVIQALNYLGGGVFDVAFTPEEGGFQATVLNLILGIP